MNPLVTLSSATLPGAVRDLPIAAALGSPVWGPLALREGLRSAGIPLIDVSRERDPVAGALEALAAADVV